MTWKDAIIKALESLGGHATLEDIYDKIDEISDKTKTKSYKATIRGTLEKNSSDSEAYDGRTDTFYMYGQKGDGEWGLRSFDDTLIKEKHTEYVTKKAEDFNQNVKHPADKQIVTLEQYKRDLNEEKNKKEKVGYVCEIDKTHETFLSEDGNQYVEVHHLIPLHHQDKFKDASIDIEENMICLCPNCHRMLHHQEISSRKQILKDIYIDRNLEMLLATRGIKVTLDDFLQLST